jgi:uncharacterized RDD family membrane protein YckC
MKVAWQIREESPTVDYAGFWIRLVAFIIDGIILVLLSRVINGLWSMAGGEGFWGGSTEEMLVPTVVTGTTSSMWIVNFIVFLAVFIIYFIGFWAWRGQTPGKMLLRLRVVRFSGEGIGWGAATMRFLGYIISLLLVLSGYLWIVVDARRQGFHDKIAETFVINVPRKRRLAVKSE